LLLVELFHLMQHIFIAPLQPMERLLLQVSHLPVMLWLLQAVVVEDIVAMLVEVVEVVLVVLDI
jgi:hypothetical protein